MSPIIWWSIIITSLLQMLLRGIQLLPGMGVLPQRGNILTQWYGSVRLRDVESPPQKLIKTVFKKVKTKEDTSQSSLTFQCIKMHPILHTHIFYLAETKKILNFQFLSRIGRTMKKLLWMLLWMQRYL